MGAAAYNRGTKALAAQIAAEDRPAEFALMDDLNAAPRSADAVAPLGPVDLVFSHGVWWAECPTTGRGYHYPTLRAAVAAWLIDVVEYDTTAATFRAIPRAA